MERKAKDLTRSSMKSIALLARAIVAPLAVVLAVATAPGASAQQAFKSAEEAAASLADAAKGGDVKQLVDILGPEGAKIASSGDPVADAAMRERFASAYAEKHSIVPKGDDKMVVIVGNEDFPLPIPIVRTQAGWRFDAREGSQELLFRRIGRNELDAIQTCLAYVDAQKEYADKNRTGAGPGVYAQRFVSHDGTTDGLYWPSANGEEQSPLGAFVARASAEGYRAGTQSPYHGYYYRILTRQGANAPGGELDYVVKGRMIGGFALVAYPAEYASSGIMTFIVNHEGTVYEKDLGPQTAKLAQQMTAFDPDPSWKKVDPAYYRRP